MTAWEMSEKGQLYKWKMTDLIANLQFSSTCPKDHQIATKCFRWSRVQLCGKRDLQDRAPVIIFVTSASINDIKSSLSVPKRLHLISFSKLSFSPSQELALKEQPAKAHCIQVWKLFCRYPGNTTIRMKKSGPALRQELGDISYLEAHP